ncbi:hypothetical protein [Engelhardtia mirabilis]|uniref:C-type lectin domain-containing protein n=1 Tax=Engelhardtia mirabilis TaxID=2528011 RepID=A0A518BT76_9BACT|nr:hypothetical protein Pla133_52790 [Planctomycetes bacterium Pla133]QDV04483.1 hypothetical protein Pla86_52790 [Planctomycetes bacterium Pla86]
MAAAQSSPPGAVMWSVQAGGNGHTYLPVKASVTWPEARVLAEQAGGYLATPESVAENDFIVGLVADDLSFWQMDSGGQSQGVRGPWLGGIQDPAGAEPGGSWMWLTADPLVQIPWETWGFTNWAAGQPGNTSGGQDWLAYFCKNAFAMGCGTWNDAGPSDYPNRSYIIEFGVQAPEGPVAILEHNGRGYEIVREAATLTWGQAEANAATRGAILGSPKDSQSDAFIRGLLAPADFSGIIGPWLGGAQVPGSGEPQGTWLWPDGSQVALPGDPYPGEWGNPSLPKHFQQQPNNACPSDNENRMHYLFEEAPAWNDLPPDGCNEGPPLAWIAEYPIPFVARTSGGGVGDLTLEMVPQPTGDPLLPSSTLGVIVLVSLSPAPGGPGSGPLSSYGLVADSLFQASLGFSLQAFSPVHFPATSNPYETGPVSFPAGLLPPGLMLEFRAVAYTPAAALLYSGVSRLEV